MWAGAHGHEVVSVQSFQVLSSTKWEIQVQGSLAARNSSTTGGFGGENWSGSYLPASADRFGRGWGLPGPLAR